MTFLLLLLQLATWEPVKPPILHAGHWQSCDGAERVLEHAVLGKVLWTLHLGPGDEFALYSAPEPHEDDHGSTRNLLGNAYAYDALQSRSGRTWTVPSLRLWVNVIRGGEHKRETCQEFYVKVVQQ